MRAGCTTAASEIKRSDNAGAGRIRACDQRFEPAALDIHVVVDEQRVFGPDGIDHAHARLLGPERLVDAHDFEPPRLRTRREDVAQP
jgi:hypothetical protein